MCNSQSNLMKMKRTGLYSKKRDEVWYFCYLGDLFLFHLGKKNWRKNFSVSIVVRKLEYKLDTCRTISASMLHTFPQCSYHTDIRWFSSSILLYILWSQQQWLFLLFYFSKISPKSLSKKCSYCLTSSNKIPLG